MRIRENIEGQVKAMAHFGHPNLIGRFVLEYGKPFVPVTWDKPIMEAKMCFRNAFEAVTRDRGMHYVEGYAMNKQIGFPFHHAWVSKDDVAYDPTLKDPDNYEYFGVEFDRVFAMKAVAELGFYCLLDRAYHGVNVDLMKRFEPKFGAIIDKILDENIRSPGGQIMPI